MTSVPSKPGGPGGAGKGGTGAEGVRLHAAAHRWYLRNARACLKAGNLDHALRWCSWAAHLLSDQRSGILASPELETVLTRLAERLPSPPAPAVGPRQGPRRWLHVFTQTYPVGGHTALAARWIQADPDPDIHSALLLAQEGPTSEGLVAAVRARGGEVLRVGAEVGLLERAARLRAMARADHDVIVLHVHPWDVVAAVAFGVPGGPPVLCLNHADHIFWAGAAIADLTLHIRPLAREWSDKYRGLGRNALLPIPLPPARPAFADQAAGVEARAEARRRLGIPPEACLLLSIGNATKYPAIPGSDFVEIAASALDACPSACIAVVGPPEDDRWRAARERAGGRLLLFSATPDLEPFHDAADVYLDPIPTGSLTAFLEVARRGVPCVLSPRSCPYPLYVEDGALAVLERPADLRGYLRQVRRLVESPEERRRLGETLARAVEENHCGAGWRRRLAEVKAALPSEHQVFTLPLLPALPDAYADFWNQACGPFRPDLFLRHVLTLPLRNGLTPRLNRRWWKTVLRQCSDGTPRKRAGLLEAVATLDLYREEETALFLDAGAGYDGAHPVCLRANTAVRDFRLTFDVSGRGPVRGVRWDPMEYRWCAVRITGLWARDSQGRETALDPLAARSNGARRDDGTVVFETIDPMFLLPVEGDVVSVTIEGCWERRDHPEILLETERRLRAAEEVVRLKEDALQIQHCASEQNTYLYLDCGQGYGDAHRVSLRADMARDEFRLPFNLSGHGPVRGVRWDPMEYRWCAVRITGLWVRDSQGRETALDPLAARSNGARREDGTVVFETIDPWFVLPCQGDAVAVTIEGSWERRDYPEAVVEMERRFLALQEALHRKEEEIQRLLLSRSWRVTKPLRDAGKMLRDLKARVRK